MKSPLICVPTAEAETPCPEMSIIKNRLPYTKIRLRTLILLIFVLKSEKDNFSKMYLYCGRMMFTKNKSAKLPKKYSIRLILINNYHKEIKYLYMKR